MSDLLNLDGVSRRSETVRWELLDNTLAPIGVLNPIDEQPASITNNSNASIKRTLLGLTLEPTDLASVNPITDRVRAYWVLSDGSEYSLGVFLFGDVQKSRFTWGLQGTMSLVDQCFVLDAPLAQTVSYPVGTSISDALTELANSAGITNISIDPTSAILGGPMTWIVGQGITLLRVMNELAANAGFYSAYFDNDGTLIFRQVPDVDSVVATYDWDANKVVIANTIFETNNILESPNRYVVVDSSNTDTVIAGYYDIPDAAPHSIVNRGFPVVALYDTQGLENQTQAEASAAARANQDGSTYSWTDLQTTADPRFDTFDVVLWQGVNWRSQSWQLTLGPGGPMRHSLRRQYVSE